MSDNRKASRHAPSDARQVFRTAANKERLAKKAAELAASYKKSHRTVPRGTARRQLRDRFRELAQAAGLTISQYLRSLA